MKRVLIVAYYFPPVRNMGSHRWLRFVRHLPDHGWEPVVLTGASPGWTEVDPGAVEKLPANVIVERVPALDLTEVWKTWSRRAAPPAPGKPAAAARPRQSRAHQLSTFLNRWVMIPDKYFPWLGPAARAGERLIRERQMDAIYSTSDPVTDHLVARRLTRRTGVPWAAEFRDLWLGSPYFARAHPTVFHRWLHARLERNVVADARVVVGLSEGIEAHFARTYPGTATRVLYNCFDPADYPPAKPPADKFRLMYVGALYSSRSPEPFLAGLAGFIQQRKLTPTQIEWLLLGGSPDLDVAGLAERHGLRDYVTLAGQVPHAEAMRRMQEASALVAIQSPEDDVHIPGKLFEYIGARRPILLVAQDCEVARIVRQNQLGVVAAPNAGAVTEAMAQLYAQWEAGGVTTEENPASAAFDIQTRTRQLAEILDSLARKR
jgi:glycosyltransferase involved in cell wall biosynthesis